MNPLMGGNPSMGGGMPGIMQAAQSVKRMMQMLNLAKNPKAAIMQAAQQNPALGSIMQMCNGKNPQSVFEEQCKQHGIDPNSAVKQIQDMLQ